MTNNDDDRTERTSAGPRIGRRGLLGGATALAAGGAAFAVGGGTAAASGPRHDSPLRIIPIPEQVPAREGYAPTPGGGRLWYWDTGGRGTPIVFLHPGSGSGEIWPYQQPYFAKAGYRVIGYSRRGYYKSSAPPAGNPGTASEDLEALLRHLRIDRFHLVGVAAGGGVSLDYVLSHEDRVISYTLAATLAGPPNTEYAEMLKRLRPESFYLNSTDFIELGPSYRALNPEGVAAWVEIHDRADHSDVSQGSVHTPTWADIERLRVPTLLLWGDGDLYTPPSVQRVLASHLRNVESVIANESGHAPHWERSDIFNPVLRRHLRRHSR